VNPAQKTTFSRKLNDLLGFFLLILFLPILLPLLVIVLPLYLLYKFILYLSIWLCWCTRKKFILFVYSDSPIWHDYIEQQILPHIKDRAFVLNWSEHKKWRRWFPSLPIMAFRHFGGSREFNPFAAVFRPFRLARTFRFFNAFKEFKHSKPDSLEKMRQEFLDLVENPTARKII
jgi:hypothetical protein